MNWFDCLQSFEAIAQTQSFVGAARMLSLPNSVVTKRIQWLERELHCTLLIRTTRKVMLSDAGEHLLKKIKPLLNEWQDIHRQLTDYQSQPQGEIVLCLPPNMSGLLLFSHVFKKFLETYPHLQLNLTTTHEPIRLTNAKVDVLIATEKYVLDPGSTVGIKLFNFTYDCYAAPTFIEKHGQPKTPKDLSHYNCLVFGADNLWEFSNKTFSVTGSLRADSGDALMAAGVAGAGLIYIPSFFAKNDLKAKQLTRVLPAYAGKKDKLMLFYLKHEYKTRKIELLIQLFRQLLIDL